MSVEHSIQSVSHYGDSMEFRSLSVILLLISPLQAGHAQVGYKPFLSVEPDWLQIFTGETVTLTCTIPGWSVNDWMYDWYQNNIQIDNPDENYYIIRDINVHQSSQYHCCCFHKSGQELLRCTDEVTVNVIERPKASLILVPTGQMFTGEKVTLRCDIQGHTDTEWSYSWYEDGDSNRPVHSSDNKKEYSFSVVESDSGKYTCRGERRSDSQRSEISNAVTLTVSGECVTVFFTLTSSVDNEAITVKETLHFQQQKNLCLHEQH
ncbi:Fc receptor-like protein 5 [Colossoma macropomum]|uniref:Fc receptor-like protein 5 n=1 Tax=Colossoma macropomum TaxID=42526 RepID=UPI001865416B|nr:Fc receptor-like protein 5 [Colossoma macropomum]